MTVLGPAEFAGITVNNQTGIILFTIHLPISNSVGFKVFSEINYGKKWRFV